MAEPRRKRKDRGGAGAGDHAGPPANGTHRGGADAAGGGRADPAARGRETSGAHANGAAAANGTAEASRPRPTPRERMEAGYAKAEVRNQAAREALVPLAPGERPAVVTVSAILAGCVAASILITYAAGVKVNGAHPALSTTVAPALIMGVLAWGMWRARYWAVVCFQAVLVFLIFAAVYALLVEANSVTGFAVTVGLLAVSGTLFWLMVKAMARIQMPDQMPRR